MEKLIKKLLLNLKIEIFAVLLIGVIVFVLGELDVIPNGLVEPGTQMEFNVNTIFIIYVLLAIPGSLQLFKLNTTRNLRRMDKDEALVAYHLWSAIRLLILGLGIWGGVAVYFLCMGSVTGLLCSLACVFIVLYCWPKRDSIDKYLENLNNDN